MKNNFIFISIFSLVFTSLIKISMAQDAQSSAVIDYIQSYAPIAVEEMIRTGVPASIKIAQGILETNAGRGDLVVRSNNHFGIKCKTSWNGEKVYHDDDEVGECFRKYASAYDSYVDHSNYLKSQPRYSFLFNYDKDDYSSWAWGLKKAGYATNPIYAQTLIKYIEQYKLNLLNKFNTIPGEADLNDFLVSIKDPRITNNNSSLIAKIEDQNNHVINSREEVKQENITEEKIIYPKGIFKVNGTKVFHAKKGTSLLALAKKYKVTMATILHWNDLPSNTTILNEDQLIYVQKKKKFGEKKYHVVKQNEDLREISQVEGIQLSSILKMNRLRSGSSIKPGEKILLQSQKNHTTHLLGRAPVHIVKKGESLYTISKKYKVSIDSIKEANSISNDELRIGQKLKIIRS